MIKYTKRVIAQGRNGSMYQDGIQADTYYDAIRLTPINSKGKLGNAWVEIPPSDIPKVIKALQDAKKEWRRMASDDQTVNFFHQFK